MRLDKTQSLLLVVTVALAAAGFAIPDWLSFLLMLALAKALVVQGVVIQMRAGLVSFGQGLFYCLGGYAIGVASHFFHLNDALLQLGLAVAVAVVVAAILGLLMARYRDIFFAMLSLALSMILFGLLVKSQALGSTDGFNVTAQSYLGWVPKPQQQKLVSYLLTVVVAGIAAQAIHLFMASGGGTDQRCDSRDRDPGGVSGPVAALAALRQLSGGGGGLRHRRRPDRLGHRPYRSGDGLLDHLGRIRLHRIAGRHHACGRTVRCRHPVRGGAHLCHRIHSP